MGEHKRVSTAARAARTASAQAATIDTSRDPMRRAVDALVQAGRHGMRGMSPDQRAVVLGTAVGVFAAAAEGAEGVFASRVDELARHVIEQAQEAA